MRGWCLLNKWPTYDRPELRTVGIVAAFVLLMSACGGGSSGANSTATGTDTAEPTKDAIVVEQSAISVGKELVN
jgi:hypothetical protein